MVTSLLVSGFARWPFFFARLRACRPFSFPDCLAGGSPAAVAALNDGGAGEHLLLREQFLAPLTQLSDDFAKFAEMVETTIDLEARVFCVCARAAETDGGGGA